MSDIIELHERLKAVEAIVYGWLKDREAQDQDEDDNDQVEKENGRFKHKEQD